MSVRSSGNADSGRLLFDGCGECWRARRPRAVRHRLGQIEVELERAVNLAVKTGGLDLATRKIEALRAEQSELLEQARTEPLALPPIEDLGPVIEARVRDFRWAFDS